jgi:hypothetical protein
MQDNVQENRIVTREIIMLLIKSLQNPQLSPNCLPDYGTDPKEGTNRQTWGEEAVTKKTYDRVAAAFGVAFLLLAALALVLCWQDIRSMLSW